MKAACPRCGRKTHLDGHVGDFPTRCTRCGALVRRRTEKAQEAATVDARETQANEAAGCRRIERGMLAGLLLSRSEPEPAIIHGGAVTAVAAPARRHILCAESRLEIQRARARQQALTRAELRGNQQVLSTLTWIGLILVLALGLGAAALKAQAMWHDPAPARADVLHVE